MSQTGTSRREFLVGAGIAASGGAAAFPTPAIAQSTMRWSMELDKRQDRLAALVDRMRLASSSGED